MDKFEEAICEHNPLYKEGLQDKYYQGAKWAWQSRQAEVEEKDKRITELEKTEFALAKVKQILNKHIKTKLLESIIVRELIDMLFSNKAQGDIKYPELCDGLFDLNGLFFIRMYGITYEFKNNSWVECNGVFTQEDLINIRYINKYQMFN